MKITWKRKEHVTRGADPTQVVTWESPELGVKIVEFQDVYVAESDNVAKDLDAGSPLWEALHKALEAEWQQRFMDQDGDAQER